MYQEYKIGVVVPCYKVTREIGDVLKTIPLFVDQVICVDDCCPDHSGRFIEDSFGNDKRVVVIFNERNEGVGGAVKHGYEEALKRGCDIVVKIDGDGQMNPALIESFIKPITEGDCDYTKGNRFYDLAYLLNMPSIRIFGNAVLSFFSKLSSGYWNIFDPTNGFTAIHRKALMQLPLDKIANDYFFESDMLFRLNVIKVVVRDIPMKAVYGDEISNLKIGTVLKRFPIKHIKSFCKRIFYNYFLRDFSLASIELVLGSIFIIFGSSFGLWKWCLSIILDTTTSSGGVMLAALPIIIGSQLILSFINYDVQNTPKIPISK